MLTQLGVHLNNPRLAGSPALPQQLPVSLLSIFIAVMLEELRPHRYVVENGGNVQIARQTKTVCQDGNSLVAVNQQLSKDSSAKLGFEPPSGLRSSCCWATWIRPNHGIRWRLRGNEMFAYYLTQWSSVDVSLPFLWAGTCQGWRFPEVVARGRTLTRIHVFYQCLLADRPRQLYST